MRYSAVATATGTPMSSAIAEVTSVPNSSASAVVDVAADVPVVAEDEAQPERAERVRRLADQPDEEVRQQRQDQRRQRGQTPLEDLIGQAAGRRPLETERPPGPVVALASTARVLYETGEPLQVIVPSCVLSLAASDAGSGAYGSLSPPEPSVCWPAPNA